GPGSTGGTGTGGTGGFGGGTGDVGGTGTGTGGPGSGGGTGDPGGTDPGTSPGGDDAGSGPSEPGSGAIGGDSEGPGEGPSLPPEEAAGPESPGAGPEEGNQPEDQPETVGDRIFPWSYLFGGGFLLIVAFLVLLAVHILRATFRARRAEVSDVRKVSPPPESLRAELLKAFKALSQAEGRSPMEARDAILAAYDHMVRLFRSRGVNPQQHLTAREVEALAMDRLELSPSAAQALRRLFEEARYSLHRLGDAHRREAIESLRRVRSELASNEA
ncbi:MAG: DUF4129 domain-containing protein, partial [Thermoplasmata archaeon]|nr:DUF4129 domain-containing protein [Thermoplasmata archaeon]